MIVIYTWRGKAWRIVDRYVIPHSQVKLERVDVLAGRQRTAPDEPEMPLFRPTGEFETRSSLGLRKWRP